MQELQKKNNKKVLLHACCAVCSGYPIMKLRELGYEPVVYFYNPNIYPKAEYDKRLEAQLKLCSKLKCEIIVEKYDHDLYDEVVKGYENCAEGGERCTKCFELRLLKTVQKAQELGYKHYTTSISVSPHKNFNVVSQVGQFFSGYFKIDFLALDFKKQDGFLKTMKLAKELGLYRQNFCGCKVSMQRILNLPENLSEKMSETIK